MKSRWSLILLCCSVFPSVAWAQPGLEAFKVAREKMVREELTAQGIKNDRVLRAMGQVPREQFLPLTKRKFAYLDMPIPIGEAQYMPPPLRTADLLEQIDPQPSDKVLVVGTGSGYGPGVLSRIVREVYAIEIVPELAREAAATFQRLKYSNITSKQGDGFAGWAEHAPYDKMLVECAPESVPPPLVEQLKEGGVLVIPVGEHFQQTLFKYRKQNGKLTVEQSRPTLFLPMIGKAKFLQTTDTAAQEPQILNPSFETEFEGDKNLPANWYFVKQAQVIEYPTAPNGKRVLWFKNETPGHASIAIQGFACDGRKVKLLTITLNVKVKSVIRGQNLEQLPRLEIMYLNENNRAIHHDFIGPWFLTGDWTEQQARFQVPPQARAALIRIGLLGATGEAWFDNLRMKVN